MPTPIPKPGPRMSSDEREAYEKFCEALTKARQGEQSAYWWARVADHAAKLSTLKGTEQIVVVSAGPRP